MIDSSIQILSLERHALFRRKVDYVRLVASLLKFTQNEILRNRALGLLVELWKDPDSEVRVNSIKMVKMLGELGLKEVVNGFNESTTGPVNLMKEVSTLLNNNTFADKDVLTDLLQWYFGISASKKAQ
jgi:hypothetical protein